MISDRKLNIIAFVGLCGSGKTTATEYITEKGFPKVYFGGVILTELEKAGLEYNEENGRKIREELRQKNGRDFVVKQIIQQIYKLKNSGQHDIVADGLYSWTEYKALKHEFPGEITVVAIYTPRHLRHHRLSMRTERPLNEFDADGRDWAEIENLEKGGPIAMADYTIVNDGDIEKLHSQIDEIISDINFVK